MESVANLRTSNTVVKNRNCANSKLLEENISQSENVVLFTHDYYANVYDKNRQLVDTAKFAKKHGVKKVIAVAPIEFINYYTAEKSLSCAVEDENNAIDEALFYFKQLGMRKYASRSKWPKLRST